MVGILQYVSLSGLCLAFLDLKLDKHPIHLADGKVIYSSGVGALSFLSACGYSIII
jgi:hypothetical protein